jgi:hypothetical protein
MLSNDNGGFVVVAIEEEAYPTGAKARANETSMIF